jgi:hypothetical protein
VGTTRRWFPIDLVRPVKYGSPGVGIMNDGFPTDLIGTMKDDFLDDC